jgi:hypothetical protein
MARLSAGGQALVKRVAAQTGFSENAVEAMVAALASGYGTQAQFSHPEFGGMGQWSQGGMIMIGDMFNQGLAARVSQLADTLAGEMRGLSVFEQETAAVSYAPGFGSQSQSQGGYGQYAQASNWWPGDLGQPSSTGAQNDMAYAVFPGARRLAIRENGVVTVYDTGDHMIGGVSQQQGSSRTLTFSSQNGTVGVDQLKRITPHAAPEPAAWEPAPVAAEPAPFPSEPAPLPSAPAPHPSDPVAMIERLHELNRKGILSDSEYQQKKAELLKRL